MSIKIYHTAYVGKDVKALPGLLDKLDAIIADVRFNAFSPQIKWRGDYLELLLKHNYRHVPQLGKRGTENNKIQISNLDLGIRAIESWKKNVLLFCACGEIENCHCRLIKDRLEKNGHSVREIAEWKI